MRFAFRLLCLCAALAGILAGDPAAAQAGLGQARPAAKTLLGIDLARACRSVDGPDAAPLCRGFLAGFLAGSQANQNGRFYPYWSHAGHRWCLPLDADADATAAAIVARAERARSELHFPAALFAAAALEEAFPCAD